MLLPIWLSLELFENILKNYLKNDQIKIINFNGKQAVNEGENYTSDLFRITINYCINKKCEDKNSIVVIVKCKNEEGGTKQNLAENLHIFDKEIEMFSITFPKIYQILNEYYTLSCRCLYTSLQPHSILIFEDLTQIGFKVLSRHEGFDLEHCFKIIEKIAQLHAASVIMYKDNPHLVRYYQEGLYTKSDCIRKWLNVSYKALSDACKRWPGYEKFGYKLEALGDEAIERGLKSLKKKFDGFNVLNHGDLWVNNMMFSYYPDGKLQDARFIDFQMNIFTSPAIDLHYFISTSTNMNVKLNHIKHILDYYYAQLIVTLAKFQYPLEKVPSREEFLKDFNSRAFYGLMGSATVLALVKASAREDANLENIIEDNSESGFRYHIFNNDRYRKHMEFLLPYYDNFGVLD